MQIRWTILAASDLEHIADHIRRDNPKAALEVIRTICNGVLSLKTFPDRGREGRRKGSRELVFSSLPYIIVYRVGEQSVDILRVYHGAQKRI